MNSFLRKKPYYKTGIYGKVENINYFLPFLGDIKKKIKTFFAPDFVVAHMPSGIIFANKLGVSFSAAVHASDIEVLTNPLYRCYFKSEMEKAYKNAKQIKASHIGSTHWSITIGIITALIGVIIVAYKN